MQRRLHREARKNVVCIFYTDVPGQGFRDNTAKVGRQCEVSSFIELVLLESRPLSIHAATLDRSAEHEHNICVTVICTAIAVLARGTSELAHRDNDGLACQIAQVIPER